MIENAATAFYTLAFLSPGFVIASVIGLFVPPKADVQGIALLRFLTLSFVNYAIWSWLVYLLLTHEPLKSSSVWATLGWAWIVFIGPVILGLIGGKCAQCNSLGRLLGRFGFDTIHPIPAAWDYVFTNQREPAFVILTLQDGSTVAGLYGSKSFSSSDGGERDMFLEEIYRIDDNGDWKSVERSGGVFVGKDQIRTIEFFTAQESSNE